MASFQKVTTKTPKRTTPSQKTTASMKMTNLTIHKMTVMTTSSLASAIKHCPTLLRWMLVASITKPVMSVMKTKMMSSSKH